MPTAQTDLPSSTALCEATLSGLSRPPHRKTCCLETCEAKKRPTGAILYIAESPSSKTELGLSALMHLLTLNSHNTNTDNPNSIGTVETKSDNDANAFRSQWAKAVLLAITHKDQYQSAKTGRS